jgi:alginate O-acetyltransferase complex protein AlgI
MTLGSFFRDYVYIPLGGNRRHQILNILIVWMLTGLWHGAYWNYVIWGLWFGLFLVIEKFTFLKWKRFPSILTRIFSLVVVFLGWGIFYFEDFSKMKAFFNALFCSQADFSLDSTVLLNNGWLLLVALLFCLPVNEFAAKISAPKWCTVTLKTIVSGLILIVSAALLVGATNNAFIYTRF